MTSKDLSTLARTDESVIASFTEQLTSAPLACGPETVQSSKSTAAMSTTDCAPQRGV